MHTTCRDVTPRLDWAIIIENKFHSTQREGQLEEYKKRVRSIFEHQERELKVRGIFLTLHDEVPKDETYAAIQYSAICEILSSIMETEAEIVRENVAMFVRHYIEIIREAAGMSDEAQEMEMLARELYRSHRKILDFVMEHGATTDFVMALEPITGKDPDHGEEFIVDDIRFTFNAHTNAQMSFLPSCWIERLGGRETKWEGCENYWARFPLICWCQLFPQSEGSSGLLRLFAEVGPVKDHEFRKNLIDKISKADLGNVKFQRGAAEPGKKYSKFLKKADIQIKDVHNIEEIEQGIRFLLKKFEPVIEGVAPLLDEFAEYGVSKDG
jgi:DNA-binding phage protein